MADARKFGLIVLVVLGLAGWANAADAPPQRMPNRPMMLERMQDFAKDLNLTPDQKTKFDQIVSDAREKLQGMRSDLEQMDPQERMGRIREVIEGVRDQLKTVLTPEQAKQLKDKLDALRPNGRGPLDRATTRPALNATSRPASNRPNGGSMIERLRDNLSKLDLNADQKSKIKDLFEDVRPQFDALRQQAETGDDAARGKLRDLFQDTRQKLSAILTDDQRQKLRSMMENAQGGPGGFGGQGGAGGRLGGGFGGGRFRDREGRNNRPNTPATTQSSMKMQGDDEMAQKDRPDAGSAIASADTVTPAGPGVGDMAPPVLIKKSDGSNFQLSSLKGRVVVLEFGSYSSPAFRSRIEGMEKLRNDYGMRAQFFVVYTKDAHATGEWDVDRNKDEGVSVSQPTTYEARKAVVDTMRQKTHLTTPVLIDSMGNEAAAAFGAGENSAFVINRDGKIVARQRWFEPNALRHAIDQAVAATPTTKPAT